MTRNVASALAFATTVAAAVVAAAILSSNAFADDITVDNKPFVSNRSRADVQAELMRGAELGRTGASEWSMQHNELPQPKTAYTREQARSEYKNAREDVHALQAEDSGSSYFAIRSKSAIPGNASATMGGPAR